MSDEGTQLSNPFSTGGGGHNFENQVQAAFVVLMLTGGVVPCPQPWPIKKIKLQGRYEGFNTDDFIVFLENRSNGHKAQLLAQIKHSVSIADADATFGEVLRAAWLDFQNPELFDPKSDAIALITGPLSALDTENVRTILEWARHSASAQEFLDKVKLANFSSDAKRNKLQTFRAQLKKANQGVDVTDDEFWHFLRSFHLLGYDLDLKSGVTLSLLNSHIAQFNNGDLSGLWEKIANEVKFFDQNAGTITTETISPEISEAFRERVPVSKIPPELLKHAEWATLEEEPDYLHGDTANALMLATLLGSWDEKTEGDRKAIQKLVKGDD